MTNVLATVPATIGTSSLMLKGAVRFTTIYQAGAHRAVAWHAAEGGAGAAHCRSRSPSLEPRIGICRRERHPQPQRGDDQTAAGRRAGGDRNPQHGRDRSRARQAHRVHPPRRDVELALATGMRRGELLGLMWGDIDLDRGTLRVERSVEETKAGLRLKPPKTKRGRRNLRLPNARVQHRRGRAGATPQYHQGMVARGAR